MQHRGLWFIQHFPGLNMHTVFTAGMSRQTGIEKAVTTDKLTSDVKCF